MGRRKGDSPNRGKGLGELHVEEGDNARYLRFSLSGLALPPIDIADPKQVWERSVLYFNQCVNEDMKPGLAGLCNFLGISRTTWFEWRTGVSRKTTHQNLCKKISMVLESQMESYLSNGKINPVSGIFLMKNSFEHYEDKSTLELSQKDPLGDRLSDDEIRRKYLESVPDSLQIEQKGLDSVFLTDGQSAERPLPLVSENTKTP